MSSNIPPEIPNKAEDNDNHSDNHNRNDNDILPINIQSKPLTGIDFGYHDHLLNSELSSNTFKGDPSCKKCNGSGCVKSKGATGKLKPCHDCFKSCGNCPICHNTGYRIIRKTKKCECHFGKVL